MRDPEEIKASDPYGIQAQLRAIEAFRKEVAETAETPEHCENPDCDVPARFHPEACIDEDA